MRHTLDTPVDGFKFRPEDYGEAVAAILAIDSSGERLMPLQMEGSAVETGRARLKGLKPRDLFPAARAPEAALAGLYVYFSCFDEAHGVAQDLETPEGSYWHAIVHRQEPDAGNAGYWFRQLGTHPIFPALARVAGEAGPWDPFAFVEFCEEARRQPGTQKELRARTVQRFEWQILFDYCARAVR